MPKHTWHTLGPRGGAKIYRTADDVILSSEIWPPMDPHPAQVTLVVPWEMAVEGGLVVEAEGKPKAKGSEAAALAAARSYREEEDLPEEEPLSKKEMEQVPHSEPDPEHVDTPPGSASFTPADPQSLLPKKQ